MNITELQSRLNGFSHLLTPQRDCIERLLFQLAFNSCSTITITGAEGSGKSTLALACAELFSEQFNIAFITADVEPKAFNDRLMQQWFGCELNPVIPLLEQVEMGNSPLPLLLIIDDVERVSDAVFTSFLQLPCLIISFSTFAIPSAELVLNLNQITLGDAEQLLQSQGFNTIEIAERYGRANGNLNLLMSEIAKVAIPRPEVAPLKLPLNAIFYLAITFVLALLAYLFWPEVDNGNAPPQIHQDATIELALADTEAPNDGLQKPTEQPDARPVRSSSVSAETDNQLAEQSNEITPSSVEHGQNEPDLVVSELLSDESNTQTESIVLPTNVEDVTVSTPIENNPVVEPDFKLDEALLLGMQKEGVALQLAVLSSEQALFKFKANYPSIKVLGYQRNWQGIGQWVVLIAPYDDSSAAKRAMTLLPEKLANSGPFIKSLQAIHAEIKARQTSLHSDFDGN